MHCGRRTAWRVISFSGRSLAGNIVTQAFSGSFGLLKTDSSLAAFDSQGKRQASMDAAAGPALFAFSPGGTTALAYIASNTRAVRVARERICASFAQLPGSNRGDRAGHRISHSL